MTVSGRHPLIRGTSLQSCFNIIAQSCHLNIYVICWNGSICLVHVLFLPDLQLCTSLNSTHFAVYLRNTDLPTASPEWNVPLLTTLHLLFYVMHRHFMILLCMCTLVCVFYTLSTFVGNTCYITEVGNAARLTCCEDSSGRG